MTLRLTHARRRTGGTSAKASGEQAAMRDKTGQKSALAGSRLKVGAAVRARRMAAGLSLSQLADRIDVALSTMSKIETGKLPTSFERLDSISRALGADI